MPWQGAARAAEQFGGPVSDGSGNFGAVMERTRRLRAAISRVDGAERSRDLGVDVFLGEGRFVASDAAEVDCQQLRFRRAVIATGARAAAPPIPGLDRIEYLTNETIFSLTGLPRRLGVIGGGPTGCEMAQSFARFGSEVHLFDIADQVLVREDADAVAVVQEAMVKDGVELHLGAQIVDIREAMAGDTGDKVIVVEEAGGATNLSSTRSWWRSAASPMSKVSDSRRQGSSTIVAE